MAAFKFVILALTLAYANAGNLIAQPAAVHYSSAPAVSSSYFQQASAPVAYAKTYAAPAVAAQPIAYSSGPAVAYQAPSVGLSQQLVSKSLGGGQSISSYSKAEDSAFSSVRKYDTRVTNDGLAYAAPAQIAYSAPFVTKTYAAPVAYSAPAQVLTKTYAAPGPVFAKSYAAPASYAAPISYAAPSAYATHASYAAPISYAAPSAYAAPAAYAAPYAAPFVTKTYAAPAAYATSAYAAPTAYAAPAAYAPGPVYGPPAPLLAKAAYAAPAPVVAKAAIAYSPAAVVAHTNFQGYGIEYHY